MKSLLQYYEELAEFMGNPVDLQVHYVAHTDVDNPEALLVFLETITDGNLIHNRLLVPLLESSNRIHDKDTPFLKRPSVESLWSLGSLIRISFESITQNLFEGKCVVLYQGCSRGLAVEACDWHNRSVTQPERESSLIGPKDSFIEDIGVNVSMIRRRIRHHTLRFEEYTLGTTSRTKVMIGYMDGLVNRKALDMFKQRLKGIHIDMLLESSQIGALTSGQRFSPFPMYQLTERPDKATSAIAEGRFIVMTDTTPTCLILPVTMTCLFEASDDYYFPSISGSFLRFTRMIGLAITLYLPALYIAVTAVNQDMFRIQFMLAVASSREGVPYPAYIEVIIMLLLIELINEATVRLPKTIGGTATIVGGLIIGTAAAQSHLISYIMIVITATTAIGSYTMPNYMVGLAWRLCCFFLVLLSIPWGLYGIVVGSAMIGLYLSHIDCLGVPYAAPFVTFHYKDIFRDALFRAPLSLVKKRPSTYSKEAKGTTRNSSEGGEW
ncbi:spore germination protein [Paenibacillus hexagrammi]|uniref:Spore germination protein n=1 Tax=Paenibacillus hexagrammi TaxID=2908839 RepID=A0ABY3SBG8_9BACL|nr:spore germination protein [Paenibacillus sp. YPD9-1]UJF31289.1 spore germination protein [Paenibacillus sp. YPD9-1]